LLKWSHAHCASQGGKQCWCWGFHFLCT
jgi:hypothetical protein